MTREILFRGKRLDNGEWVYGYLVVTDGVAYIVDPNETQNVFTFNFFVKVDPKTVGQYTGLKDSYGKKIFEGDVVRGVALGGFKYSGRVKFFTENEFLGYHVADKSGAWDIRDLRSKVSLDHITGHVVGTIHDNPELLEA